VRFNPLEIETATASIASPTAMKRVVSTVSLERSP
jgi:hypothetical protein